MRNRLATMTRVLCGLALLVSLLAVPVSVAAQSPAAGDEEIPRADETVTVKRGDRTFQVRPIKRVTLSDGREAVADRLLVGFGATADAAGRDEVHRQAARAGMRARTVGRVDERTEIVDVSGAVSPEAAARLYQADPRVAFAEPDYLVQATFTPNDPLLGQQWGMSKVQAPLAWNVTKGAASVVVGILDCGIYEPGHSTFGPGHPDIAGKVDWRVDFSGSGNTDDYCGHGTHVGGTVGAATNNGLGVVGLGYNVRLLNVKVLNDNGSGTNSSVAKGIRYAADYGAKVVNLSLGVAGPCPSALRDAINYAFARNVVVVAAAGNSATSSLFSPASCANVVSVASTDSADARSSFSNYGASWVDVAAPGSSIYSTDYLGQYEFYNGTSMATPHVSGLAGLLWSTGHYGSAQQVVDRIQATADKIAGTGTFWAHGRINAYAAVAGFPYPVVVDGGHDAMGVNTPGTTWYFAEGYTQVGFDEYLTIMNPDVGTTGLTANITITYRLDTGAPQTVLRTVPANQRATVSVHHLDGGVGRGLAVAAKVESTNAVPVVVERPMYFRYGATVNGGHDAIGATAAAPEWYFAEGYTGTGFDEYLTILNPDPAQASAVEVTYFLEGGALPKVYPTTVPAGSRATVVVHDEVQGVGRGQAVAARVKTTNAVNIIVERPMYFAYSGAINGGHVVMGATAPRTDWHFAEGYTGTGFDEYLTILNPDAALDATVEITYLLADGSTKVVPVNVAASQRRTVQVHDETEGVGRGKAVSAIVRSTNLTKIVVERPMYFAYTGATFVANGGHDVMGAAAPAQDWYFAEGYTGAGFDEYLTIANANATPVTVTLTYLLAVGLPVEKTIIVNATSRYTVNVHDVAEGVGRDQAVSVKVSTVDPGGIVVERPMYFRYTMDNTI